MQVVIRYIIILFTFFFIAPSYGQKLHVAPFDGIVYKLPNGKKYWNFKEDYKDFPIIDTIKWDKINVPSRDVENGFPDIERKGAFAIMFNSSFRATETAMFEFNLTSDDGSILWIDGKEIVNNDSQGAMHLKSDTILVSEGMHEMQIWYIQAFPTKFGFIFDYKHVDMPLEYNVEAFSFDSDILFDFNRYTLNIDGLSEIQKLINDLKNYPGVTVRIVGHTDNIGAPSYNLLLSEKRANSLKEYLMSNLRGKGIGFVTSGKGASMPIADNSTELGRSQNRRVTIELEFDRN